MAWSPEQWATQNGGSLARIPRRMPVPPLTAEQRRWAQEQVKAGWSPRDLGAVLAQGFGQTGVVTPQNEPLYNESYPMPPTNAPVSLAGSAPMGNNPQTGLVTGANQPLYTASTTDSAGNGESIQQEIIQGSYFTFPLQPDASGELWGNLGEGPNGYNWNINGSPLYNPYVPGYFAEQPPVLNFPPPFTEAEFRARHLLGFGSVLSDWGEWPQVYQAYYGQALDAIEGEFGGFIYPRLILTDGMERGFTPGVNFDLEEREYDFNSSEFYHWGWMRLRYTPVMAILNLNMVYPTGQLIFQFPPAWIKPQMLSGEIRLVPPQGAISQVVLGPGGYMVMLVGGTLTDMPALLFCDYIAGMWPVPGLLKRALELRLAMMVLPVLSDAIAKGRADVVTNVDQVQYRQLFTTRSDVQGLSGRINRYQVEYNQLLRQARARFLGTTATKKFASL